jgi:hypothetical protein
VTEQQEENLCLKKSIVTSLSVSALLLTAAQANAEEHSQSEGAKAPTNVLAEPRHKHGVRDVRKKQKLVQIKLATDAVSSPEGKDARDCKSR